MDESVVAFLFVVFGAFSLPIIGWLKEKAEKRSEVQKYQEVISESEFYIECYEQGIKDIEQLSTSYGIEKVLLLAKRYNNTATREEAIQSYIASKEKAVEFAKEFFDFHRKHPEKPSVSRFVDYPTEFPSQRYTKDVNKRYGIETGTPLYRSFFRLGQQLYNASAEFFCEERTKEQAIQKSLDKFIHYRGHEKRLQMLNNYRELLVEELSGTHTIDSRALVQKEHDWAILGGLANGIGGAAAGIATAMNYQAKNAQIRQNNSTINAMVVKANWAIQSAIDDINARIKQCEKSIQEVHSKVISVLNDETSKVLMNELVFSDTNISKTITGAIKIEVKVSTRQKLTLFDSAVRANIDGIIKAEFTSTNGIVGYAYLTLPMFGSDTSPSTLTGICTSTTDPNANYCVKYSPVSLWLIEL